MSIERSVLRRMAAAVVVSGGFLAACGGGGDAPSAAPEAPAAAEGANPPAPRKTVLFVGTSLTAAYGLEPEQGFPARIQEKVDSAGLPFEVVNAGVSGETSSGARARVSGWLLRQPVDVIVLETGANDMLRGTPVETIAENLQAIVDTVRARQPRARVVLAGMLAAPNLGRPYTEAFARVYTEAAERNNLTLIPFLLDGVAGDTALNLGDGIHPSPRGHARVAETVWRTLEPVLREKAREPAAPDSAA